MDSKKLLFVGYPEEATNTIGRILENEDIGKVIVAGNIEETVKQTANQQTDLIFLNMDLLDIDGLEALRGIKEYPNFKKAPIITTSGNGKINYKSKCIGTGAIDYIRETQDYENIFGRIRTFFARENKILLAEDCTHPQRIAKMLLKKKGFNYVAIADDSEQAVKMAEN